MRKNILLIVLVAAIFVFVGAMSNSTKAAEDPVEAIRNAKTPVHLYSLAGGTVCGPFSDSLVHELPSMINTWWHSVYPPATYCHNWKVVAERGNGTPGLNPSDKLKIEHVPDGSWIWVHVEEVTKTLILTLEPDHLDTMYVEYTGGYDSLINPLTDPDYHPVCTWWHEVWPEYCPFFHLSSWIDNGDGYLSCCDTIGLALDDYPAISFAPSPVFADEARSTTGPTPPPDIDRGIRPVTRQQVTIPGVPSYLWHHGCGPTAVGMVAGYWDGNGFPDLVPGNAGVQNAAVNAMIADDSGNPNCDAPDGDHYQDYSCPIDAYPNLLPDRSQTGGAHASDCVADFFETSWSLVGNYYGWSWFSDVPGSFTDYVNWIAPYYGAVAVNKTFVQLSWATYKAEIDAGCPMVLLVDTDGDGNTDHFVTGIGYNNTTMEYGIYDTWDNNVHWYAWRGMQAGNQWGIYGITLFRISVKWHVEDVAIDILVQSIPSPEVPTMTQWGVIVLAALILASAIFILLRRRRATVPA